MRKLWSAHLHLYRKPCMKTLLILNSCVDLLAKRSQPSKNIHHFILSEWFWLEFRNIWKIYLSKKVDFQVSERNIKHFEIANPYIVFWYISIFSHMYDNNNIAKLPKYSFPPEKRVFIVWIYPKFNPKPNPNSKLNPKPYLNFVPHLHPKPV